ncbi:MAG: hypothetical protein WAP23_02890 [Candidatus Spechtbacterales bacterium]
MENNKKQFSEKLQDKALDVGGKVVEESAKNFLGIGGAFALLMKAGAVGFILIILGVIALTVFLLMRFL